MGTTIFFVLDRPSVGGDTLYLSTTVAYEHLSEPFRNMIDGLYAVHSGVSQHSVSDKKERYIREAIETVHPVVRTHPVQIFGDGANSTIGPEDEISLREQTLYKKDHWT
jgi:sulfonate dioxygenase